jgi:tetratricopeptide (TPR) repeat protein
MTGFEIVAVFAILLLGVLGVGAVFFWTWRNTGGSLGQRWSDYDEPSGGDTSPVIDMVPSAPTSTTYVYPDQPAHAAAPAQPAQTAQADAPTAPLSGEGMPVAQTTADGAPVAQTTADGAPVAQTTADGAPVTQTSDEDLVLESSAGVGAVPAAAADPLEAELAAAQAALVEAQAELAEAERELRAAKDGGLDAVGADALLDEHRRTGVAVMRRDEAQEQVRRASARVSQAELELALRTPPPAVAPEAEPQPAVWEIDEPADPAAAAEETRERSGLWRTAIVALLAILLLPLVVWLTMGWQARRDQNRFIVLVAPFREEGSGQVTATGQALARELVQVLNTDLDGRGMAVQLASAPTTALEAEALLRNDAADLLIWGDVRPGALLNRQSMRPTLFYRPTGSYAPIAWDGYNGRFAPPLLTQLSDSPINGEVVLPALVDALDAYARGDMDLAFTQLGELTEQYGLRPALPRALRANILWARGEFASAIDEYKRALPGATDELPFLLNDLAAVQLDADLAFRPNDPGELSDATETLDQAIRTQGAGTVPAIWINRATAALYRKQPDQALRELAALPPGYQRPLVALLTESAAIRSCNPARYPNAVGCGNLDAAEALLRQALRLASEEGARAPRDLRNLISTRYRGVVAEQQVLLALARMLQGRGSPLDGQLEWELEVAGPLNADELRTLGDSFERITDDTSALATAWRGLSVSADAAGRPIRASLAEGQAQRIEDELLRQHYLEALLLVEAGRANPPARASGLRAIWLSLFGNFSPPARAARLLQAQESLPAYDAEVQIGRAQRLLGNPEAAQQAYERARSEGPGRPEPRYYQAELANDRGEVAQAVGQLQETIALAPDYFPARQYLARLELSRNNPLAAIEQLRWLSQNRASFNTDLTYAQTLRQLGPAYYYDAEQVLKKWEASQPQAQVELGRLYRDAGRLDAANEVLAQVTSQEQAGVEAFFAHGQVLELQGRFVEAAEQYELAARADSNFARAYLALGALYSGPLDDRALAIRQYERALDTDTADPGVLADIGDAFLRFGQPNEAYAAFDRARRANPNDPRLYHKLGVAALAQDRVSVARGHEQDALARDPEFAEARVGLGEIARREGQFPQAADLFAQALQRDGGLEEAYIGLGRTSGDQGDWQGALVHFRRSVETNPENYLTHFWLAEALVRQQPPDYAGAIAAYANSLRIFSEFPEATFGLAQAYYGLGQRQDAWNYLDRALAQRPGYAEALLLRGKIRQELGDVAGALQDFDSAIDSDGRIAETYYRRGQLYLQDNRIGAAQDDLRRAVSLQNNFPEAHYWLGRAYFAEGDFAAALDSFDTALAQRPDLADAQSYRDQARARLDAQRAAAR